MTTDVQMPELLPCPPCGAAIPRDRRKRKMTNPNITRLDEMEREERQ